MLRLITFDLDNTLWSEHIIGAADLACRRWVSAQCPEYAASDVDRRLIRSQVVQANPGLLSDLSALRRLALKAELVACGVAREHAVSLAAEGLEVFLEARHEVEYFDGALEMLEALRENYILGVLTNGNCDIQRLGLGEYFSFAYNPVTAGVGKPAPGIFMRALDAAGVEPSEALHIGDDPERDIVGADAVGIHTLQALIEGGVPQPPSERATMTASRLTLVPELVRGLAGRLTP